MGHPSHRAEEHSSITENTVEWFSSRLGGAKELEERQWNLPNHDRNQTRKSKDSLKDLRDASGRLTFSSKESQEEKIEKRLETYLMK